MVCEVTPQASGCRPPPPSSMREKASRNHLNEEITSLLPTRIGEQYSQTISNLGHAWISPRRKCGTTVIQRALKLIQYSEVPPRNLASLSPNAQFCLFWIYFLFQDDTSYITPSLPYSMIFRYISNIYPLHGHFCNYGAFPQTWEDPFKQDPWTGQLFRN